MTDVATNRWGELVNRPNGALALQGGEEVSLDKAKFLYISFYQVELVEF